MHRYCHTVLPLAPKLDPAVTITSFAKAYTDRQLIRYTSQDANTRRASLKRIRHATQQHECAKKLLVQTPAGRNHELHGRT